MKNRGDIVVMLLLAAGLTAAGAAIWHQYRQTRRALEFWGAEAAYLIGHAESVELTATHRPTTGTGRPKPTDGELRTVDISRARGLVHFRRSLLEDENFQWEAETPAMSEGDWDIAIRFAAEESTVTLVFDLDRAVVANRTAGSPPARLTERMSRGLNQFFEDTLTKSAE